MRNFILALSLFAAVGCSKSKCEKYGEMEAKCAKSGEGGDGVKGIATAMCKASDDESQGSNLMADMLRREAACAEKYTECTEYKACTSQQK